MKEPSTPASATKRGRPATGRDRMFSLRMPHDLAAALDRWISAQIKPISRSHAVRLIIRDRLISQGFISSAEEGRAEGAPR